jgi:hypothetical protein
MKDLHDCFGVNATATDRLLRSLRLHSGSRKTRSLLIERGRGCQNLQRVGQIRLPRIKNCILVSLPDGRRVDEV